MKKKSKKIKQKSLKSLQNKADKLFSEFIRRSNCIKGTDYVSCITCGKSAHWKEMQNGHYIPRNILSTRYSVYNNHPQCVGCNVFKKGNSDEYALYLIRTYGENILDILGLNKKEIIKNSRDLYEDVIAVCTAVCTEKLKELK